MALTGIQLLEKLFADYETARDTGVGTLRDVADLYGPEYLKGAETEALAGIEQSMVGRGLSNTSLPVSASVGMKRKFQDERLRGRAGAMTNIADFMARFFPNPASLSHLATGGFGGNQSVTGPIGATTTISGPGGTYQPGQTTRIYGRTFGASSFQDSGLLYPNQTQQPQQLPQYGSSYSMPTPTPTGSTQTEPQVDTTGWTDAEKRAWANYVPGVSGYNVAALKAKG
jgi:hypothetical protein